MIWAGTRSQLLTKSLYFDKVHRMQTSATSIWDKATARQFAEAITAISDVQTMQNFLRDVMTEKEIIEISSRLEAAKMLQQGKKYTEIVEQTKLSSRTVARISDWMQNGCDGYKAALKTINAHHDHILPARA
jgi:TrpR-related protein YerC/YecD